VATLYVVDMDDTLLRTNTRVRVTRVDGTTVRYNSQQYKSYVRQPGDQVDYSEFTDPERLMLTSKPVKRVVAWMRALVLGPGSRLVIVTGRESTIGIGWIVAALAKHGVVVRLRDVFAVGTATLGTVPELKAGLVVNLSRSYDRVEMVDDSVANLDAFLTTMRRVCPSVTATAVHVDQLGQMRPYHTAPNN